MYTFFYTIIKDLFSRLTIGNGKHATLMVLCTNNGTDIKISQRQVRLRIRNIPPGEQAALLGQP